MIPSLLLLKFIQEHGNQLVILHGFDLAIAVMHYQVGKNLGYLFGDQTGLLRAFAVGIGLCVAEGHRSKLHQSAAFLGHVLDLFLKPSGRRNSSELPAGIDKDGDRVCRSRSDSPDAIDESAGLRTAADADGRRLTGNACVTDIDVVIADRSIPPGIETECDVVGSGGVAEERTGPTGGVSDAGGVSTES